MGSKKRKKKSDYSEEPESDECFAFIAGYTSGGFAYGITWEEMEKIEKEEQGRQVTQKIDNEEELLFD